MQVRVVYLESSSSAAISDVISRVGIKEYWHETNVAPKYMTFTGKTCAEVTSGLNTLGSTVSVILAGLSCSYWRARQHSRTNVKYALLIQSFALALERATRLIICNSAPEEGKTTTRIVNGALKTDPVHSTMFTRPVHIYTDPAEGTGKRTHVAQ